MRLYPAIDVKDGQCVRLKKGLFNEVTVYSERPYESLKALKRQEHSLYILLTLMAL